MTDNRKALYIGAFCALGALVYATSGWLQTLAAVAALAVIVAAFIDHERHS